MKSIGIERDKQIAEVKGEKCEYECTNDYNEERCIIHTFIPNIGCKACPDLRYKPYSIDISTAMELWEEMHKAGLIVEMFQRIDGMFLIRLGEKGDHQWADHVLDKFGDTASSAISGAWLKWKGACD